MPAPISSRGGIVYYCCHISSYLSGGTSTDLAPGKEYARLSIENLCGSAAHHGNERGFS